MKVKIEIIGQVNATDKLRSDVEKMLENHFKSFTFKWEQVRGLDK